jgi:hypothetical protein
MNRNEMDTNRGHGTINPDIELQQGFVNHVFLPLIV